ncbi:MAG: hypothetical protein HKN39_05965 [Flavobacteriales bacterium]|nr:hypothetical protein [Flavobacteriales bacterium]
MRVFLLFIILCIASCDIIDPKEEIPGFIEINSIDLDIRQPGDPGFTVPEGTSSSDIRDAWVFINDNLDGVYELPARIPVPTGDNVLRVSPGIFNNGIAKDRVIYPFFNDHLQDIDLIEQEVIEIEPTVEYFEGQQIFWHEEFEEASVKIESLPQSTSNIFSIFDPIVSFEGGGCGSIQLTDDEDHFEAQTIANLDIAFNTTLYLELNYKNTNRFTIGMRNDFTDNERVSLAGFNPSLNENGEAEWKKAYVFLTPILASLGGSSDFEIFISADKEVEEPMILLDNLKIVYSN